MQSCHHSDSGFHASDHSCLSGYVGTALRIAYLVDFVYFAPDFDELHLSVIVVRAAEEAI